MQTHNTLSFGRYLKAIRESRNIALSTIADQLRVSVWRLMLIEAENHEKLPDAIYIKGTLKAYAEIIGVDPADIIERYEINRQAYCQSLMSEQELIKSGKRSIFRMMVALGIVLIAVMVTLTIFDHFDEPDLSALKKSNQTKADVDDPVDFIFYSVENNLPAGEDNKFYRLNDRLHLKLVAANEIKVNIRVDSGNKEYYRLNPRDEVQLEASDRFNLDLSDPGGVHIFFNGKPVTIENVLNRSLRILFVKEQQPANVNLSGK